jgi:hypothetical protein
VDATSGSLVLLALLRAEWASNAGGAGGGAFQQANLLLEPTEEPPLLLLDTAGAGPGELLRASLAGGTYQQQPSPRGTGSEEEGDAEGMPAPLRCSSPAGGATLGSSSRRGSPQPGSGPTGGGRCTSPLTNYPGGVQQAVSSGCTGGLSNSWPSLAHQAVMGGGDQLRSSGAAVATSRAGGRGEEGVGCLSSTTATVARCRSAQASGRLAPSGGCGEACTTYSVGVHLRGAGGEAPAHKGRSATLDASRLAWHASVALVCRRGHFAYSQSCQ